MFRRILAVPLALVIVTACSEPPPLPPSAGGEAGSQVTPSLDPTTLRTTVVPGTTAFIEGKPCELLTGDELSTLRLRPGTSTKSDFGFACSWTGADFGMMIITSPARPLAEIEAGRPGKRIKIATRAASMAQGDGEFAGLCDLALDITRIASAQILLSRYDKDSAVACLFVVKVAALVHPRLPGA